MIICVLDKYTRWQPKLSSVCRGSVEGGTHKGRQGLRECSRFAAKNLCQCAGETSKLEPKKVTMCSRNVLGGSQNIWYVCSRSVLGGRQNLASLSRRNVEGGTQSTSQYPREEARVEGQKLRQCAGEVSSLAHKKQSVSSGSAQGGSQKWRDCAG
jgi:hypothetical protein